MKKQITENEALARLQKLCSTSEKCSYDIKKKLFEYGIESSAAAKIIEKLQADKFLSDERFAFAYARQQSRFAKWGKKKIGQQMLLKGIAKDLVQKALAEIDEQKYQQTISAELQKKYKSTQAKSPNEMMAKLLRFALSRGYEYDAAMAEIKQLIKVDDF